MASVDLFEFAFENVPVGLALVDATGTLRRLNTAGADLVGLHTDDLLNRPFTLLVHPDDLDAAVAGMAQVVDRGQAGPMDLRLQHRDGQWVWLRARAAHLPGTVGDTFVIMEDVSVEHDVTDRLDEALAKLLEESRETERRGKVLADIAAMAEPGEDLDSLVASVTRLANVHLAPLAGVVLITEAGDEMEVASIHHRDPEVEQLLRRSLGTLGRGPLTGAIADVIATGDPVLLEEGPIHPAMPPRLEEFNRRYPVGERLIVPMRTEQGAVGALVLVRHVDDPPFSPADRDLAKVTAARSALVVRNGRLDARRQVAEAAIEHRAAQQTAVAALSRAALGGEDVADLAHEATRLVCATLDVPSCGVLHDDGHPDGLLLVAATGTFEHNVGLVRHPREGGLRRALERSRTTLVADVGATTSGQELAADLLGAGLCSLALVPVVPRSAPSGLIVAAGEATTAFSDDDTTFLETIANVLASAIDAQRAVEDLRHNALHDSLTGLPNRTLVLDRLQLALEQASGRGTQAAVLICDVDRFKVVNDGLGHAAGDEVLRIVADRLRAAVRPGDTVGRFGGDEFVIVCPDVDDLESVVAIAERIAGAVAKPMEVLDAELVATASVGIALGHDLGAEAAAGLLRNADAAMYRAKERGRARYELFDDDMRARASHRLQLEAELRHALEHDELVLHYQPVVSLVDGTLAGVEALVRWDHPVRGLLFPADFVPMAGESGLIIELGDWVFAEAARQRAAWTAAGLKPQCWVSVNLAPRQLADPRLLERLDAIVEASGVDPHLLRVEITEEILVEDTVQAGAVLDALRARGVRISVDDFGTGYSSLAYLKRLPVDALKLDQGFVAGLGDDGDDRVISTAVVVMAHSLGLLVVAEGVETPSQRDVLRAMGADLAQGYLIARPMPAADLEAWHHAR